MHSLQWPTPLFSLCHWAGEIKNLAHPEYTLVTALPNHLSIRNMMHFSARIMQSNTSFKPFLKPDLDSTNALNCLLMKWYTESVAAIYNFQRLRAWAM